MPVYPDIQMNGHTLPMLLRGNAVSAYANLESSLCMLFATALGVDQQRAGLVFYKITNTSSRNGILERLIKLREDQFFAPFWKSVMKLINKIDQERNEIVHWHFVTEFTDADGPHITIGDGSQGMSVLRPPATLFTENKKRKTHADLETFANKCEYVTRAVNVLNAVIGTPLSVPETWHEICRADLPYPPPDTYLLSRNYKEPDRHPQSAGE